jgi:hypothetical protein
VTAVYVFGSYARGALTVGDIDVDIECDAKLHPGVERELIDILAVGRDWNTPFRKALKPARALQVMFSRLEMMPSLSSSTSAETRSIRRSRSSIPSRSTPEPVAPTVILSTRRSNRSPTTSRARPGSCSARSRRGPLASYRLKRQPAAIACG